MNRRKLVFIGFICGIFAMGALLEAGGVREVFSMNSSVHRRHKKELVIFTHKKHSTKFKCGTCHHGSKHQPLNIRYSDKVKKCQECHRLPGYKSKGLSESQKLRYHRYALHTKCKGCHKISEKLDKKNKIKAPVKCRSCHVRR
ncbi:MAG: cytochrome c3 family protein [bacterium]|nr:cytochrome c3 family protein [bacterium]